MCPTITIWIQRVSRPTVALSIYSPYASLAFVFIGTLDGCKFIIEFGYSVSCCQELVCEGGDLGRLIGNFFGKPLNLFLSLVVAVAKFSREVVVSCAISVNISSTAPPQIFTFAVYARVP